MNVLMPAILAWRSCIKCFIPHMRSHYLQPALRSSRSIRSLSLPLLVNPRLFRNYGKNLANKNPSRNMIVFAI
jgi:hypothetical protein